MATVKPLDPIQGFVDYINDIKPYHTKIAEVLIEYQQVDLVDITIIEDLQFVIDMFRPDDRVLDGIVCDGGYDTFPYGGGTGDIITAVDEVLNTFTIPGNRANVYVPGSQITVSAQTIEVVPPPTVVPNPPLDHTGVFTVLSSTFVPGVNPFTIITVVEDFADPIPILVPPFFYEISVQPSPINIVDEIPYSNIGDRPFEEPDENQVFDIGANSFVVDGDFTSRFTQSIRFRVNTGKNVGTYTTLYSDFVGGQTRIRVIKDIKHISSLEGSPGGGQIKEPALGYDPLITFCSPVHAETVQAVPLDSFVVDSVAFDWGATYFFDIIAVDDGPANTVTLSGDFLSILFPGDEVFIVGSDVNDGTYEIVLVTYNMGTNETTIELDGDLDPSVTFGQLRIDLADIVDWFQYNIVDIIAAPTNTFVVFGNATADLFPSQQFRALGTPSNNGAYTALTVIYDGLHTTITVADDLVTNKSIIVEIIDTSTVRAAGDAAIYLDSGDAFTITGSTGNDGVYTVESASFGTVAPTITAPIVTSGGGTFDVSQLALATIGTADQTWTIDFVDATTFTITGDIVGQIDPPLPPPPATPVPVDWDIGTIVAPNNPLVNGPYFTIFPAAWGGAFVGGDTVVFTTGISTVPAESVITITGIFPSLVADGLIENSERGGVVESYRDQGASLRFRDTLEVTMIEEEVTALVTSGLTYGGWDADYWDVGAYDENLGVLILLYGGTF